MSKVNMKATNWYKSGNHINQLNEARELSSKVNSANKLKRIENYNLSPKICAYCNSPIEYNHRTNRFCNASCSAKFNNPLKPTRTKKSRSKTSISLKGKSHLTRNSKPPYTKVSRCVVCQKYFIGQRKTCCTEHYSLMRSINQTKILKEKHKNATHRFNLEPQSWMEKVFETWIKNSGINDYETEVKFHNTELNKYYYVDFLFRSKNLVVELDGTQHFKTKDSDNVRDEFISRTTGYKIIRISAKEFRHKSKLSLITQLLGIKHG